MSNLGGKQPNLWSFPAPRIQESFAMSLPLLGARSSRLPHLEAGSPRSVSYTQYYSAPQESVVFV